MEFNKNEAAFGSSTAVEAGLRVEEIQLYEELVAFAGLSPEEQRRLMAHPKPPEEKSVKPTYAGLVRTQAAGEPVAAEAAQPVANSIPDFKELGERGEAIVPSEGLFDRSRTGDLLAGLNVDPDIVFAANLSLGTCLACGSGYGADDLFCPSCGVFIGEVDLTPKFNPTCSECGKGISAGEIFCPWCGAAPAA